MKLTIHLYDPVIYDAICDAARSELNTLALDPIEKTKAEMRRRDAISKALEPWIKDNAFVTIAFDTEAKTATVLPA